MQAYARRNKLAPQVTSIEQIPDVGRFFSAWVEGKEVIQMAVVAGGLPGGSFAVGWLCALHTAALQLGLCPPSQHCLPQPS
jgi:hypothetical protein